MTRRRPRRTLVLVLDADEFERLDAAARADERDAWQHARYLILRGLRATASAEEGAAEEEAASLEDDQEPADVA